MPARAEHFCNGDVYHLYNKSVDETKVFKYHREQQVFFETLRYYRSNAVERRYSFFRKQSDVSKRLGWQSLLQSTSFDVEVLAYNLMPNHYHLLVRQLRTDGISTWLRLSLNSFVRYYNLAHQRRGALFQSTFKAHRVTSEEQLMHVSRYIHLQQHTSGLIKAPRELFTLPQSSLRDYKSFKHGWLADPRYVLESFGGSPKRYASFVMDRAARQRILHNYKKGA